MSWYMTNSHVNGRDGESARPNQSCDVLVLCVVHVNFRLKES